MSKVFSIKRTQYATEMNTNKETKAITFRAEMDIMALIERYQKARRRIDGPPQVNRPEIVGQFLDMFKEDIDRYVRAVEKRAAKIKTNKKNKS